MPENPGQVEPGSGQVEWVDLGDIAEAGPAEQLSRRRFKLLPLLLIVFVAVAVLLALLGGGGGKPRTVTQPTPSPSASSSIPSEGGPTTPVPAAPVVLQVAPRVLGVNAGWELFGRSANAVVRIELAAGRITTTGVPPVQSSGAVALVVGADRVIIRPLDNVTGYVVRDRSAAVPLNGSLGHANVVLPGPDLLHIWRQIGSSNPPTVGLALLDGTLVGSRFSTPATAASPLEPDGAGYFYFNGVGGTYDIRSGSLKRVTTGSLVAVGPRRWVAVECDEAYRCSTVTIDVDTGARRVLGPPRLPDVPVGSVAPDGLVATTYQLAPNGGITLQLMDLTSGHARTVPIRLNPDFSDDTTVWAPDSSRLFVIDADSRVQVVDPSTALARPLGLTLPPLSQLVIRATTARS